MNRRYFFNKLASGLVAAVAPTLFLPKLIKPGWQDVALQKPVEPMQYAIDEAAKETEHTILCVVDFKAVGAGSSLHPEVVGMLDPVNGIVTVPLIPKTEAGEAQQMVRRTYEFGPKGKVVITQGPAPITSSKLPTKTYVLNREEWNVKWEPVQT